MSKNEDLVVIFAIFMLVIVISGAVCYVFIPSGEQSKYWLNEIDSDQYELIQSWEKRVPVIKQDVVDAVEDGKITIAEYDKIHVKVQEYDAVKVKYETINKER